jgi:hypothetical protein
MSNFTRGFLAGWLILTAFRSLYQDILGKEAFIKVVDAGWVTPCITVPIALLFLYVGLFIFFTQE